MNNKDLIKYDNNNFFEKLLLKIKKLFSFLFHKENKEKNEEKNEEENEEKNLSLKNDTVDYFEQYKIDPTQFEKELEKKELVEKVSNNPKLLDQLSNKTLGRILKYYKDENEKKLQTLNKISS